MKTRVPPHDYSSEQAVLACLMLEENSIDKIMGLITPDNFYNPKNALIFEAIYKLNSASKPYDLTMVASSLTDIKKLQVCDGLDYLVELTHIVPNASYIKEYAENVKSKSKLRALIKASSEISEIAYNIDKDVSSDAVTAVDLSGQIIMELSKDSSHKDPKPILDLIQDAYIYYENLYKRKEDLIGVTTDFYDINRLTNGLQPGALVIIAGRPAMGKTSFALNVAQNAASTGKTAAVFSLEMSSSQLLQRMISYESRIPSLKLRKGSFNETEWMKLSDVGSKLAALKIYMDDTASISLMDIRSKCRRLKFSKKHGLDLIIIDYLQLMENKRIENRKQQIAEIIIAKHRPDPIGAVKLGFQNECTRFYNIDKAAYLSR